MAHLLEESRIDPLPSSEAEIVRRARGGPEWDVNGPHAGLYCVLSFLPDWKEVVGFRGPSCLNTCLRSLEWS